MVFQKKIPFRSFGLKSRYVNEHLHIPTSFWPLSAHMDVSAGPTLSKRVIVSPLCLQHYGVIPLPRLRPALLQQTSTRFPSTEAYKAAYKANCRAATTWDASQHMNVSYFTVRTIVSCR